MAVRLFMLRTYPGSTALQQRSGRGSVTAPQPDYWLSASIALFAEARNVLTAAKTHGSNVLPSMYA